MSILELLTPEQLSGVAAGAPAVVAFLFANFIKAKVGDMFPEIWLGIVKKVLMVEVRNEQLGGESYYSKLLRRFVKKKKVNAWADKTDDYAVWVIRGLCIIILGIDVAIVV